MVEKTTLEPEFQTIYNKLIDVLVTSAGRVGIGNITPSSDLHITNRGTATSIGAGEATNTGLLIENPIVNNSILSILRTTGATGIKQAVMGINPNYNENNGVFLIGRSVNSSEFAMDLTTGNVGIATNAPTQTLDVAGKTRVRNLDVVPGTTIVTPVYSDTDGVLNKAVSNVYGGVMSNIVTIAPGSTATVITGIVNKSVHKVSIYVRNTCGKGGVADFYMANSTSNNAFSIKGIDGILITDTTNKAPTFTEVNKYTTSVTWTGIENCQAGGNNTQLNYTVSIPSVGIMSITNNGNIAIEYKIVLTRIF